jgi:hypothetical protein
MPEKEFNDPFNALDLVSDLQNTVNKQAAYIAELEAEKMLIIKTIIKTLNSVGLWPLRKEDNLASKAIRGVKGVISESVFKPDALAKRFSFLEEVYPLCEKYKDVTL